MSAAQRRAGVMLPVSSLPSRHGIGDFGEAAYGFVDRLAQCGAAYWQILPMNPLGYGNSPYQPYSSFAGEPLYISLDALHRAGWLRQAPPPFAQEATRVDYAAVRAFKEPYLRQAFEGFAPDKDYEAFIAEKWVYPYAVFMALKRANDLRSWIEWPAAQKNWPLDGCLDLAPFDGAIRFEMFLQYAFRTQWLALRGYANERGIGIIGDIPIYVGLDSQDVWMHRENFVLDGDGIPAVVAGVPPDYFSATGQRWGNPIYRWDHLQSSGFAFWISRLRESMRLFDIVRIDHFRGFDTYWEIPASCPTAVEGKWKEAPGYALFDAVFAALPGIQIIAEDLGMLREEVYTLRDHYHFRGMKILQFTFDPSQPPEPKAGREHMVVYTGTHDNQTVAGWFAAQPFAWRAAAWWRLLRAGYRYGKMARRFVQLALDDAADMAIIPVQDVLALDDTARINTPGTVGPPNWEWKLADFGALDGSLPFLLDAILRCGRA